MAKYLNLGEVDDRISPGVCIWTQCDGLLIWVSHPRKVRQDKNLVPGKRKVGMCPILTDVRIAISTAPTGARPTRTIVDGDRVIRDDEFGIALRRVRNLPDCFRPNGTVYLLEAEQSREHAVVIRRCQLVG